jgi:hypothetical protein
MVLPHELLDGAEMELASRVSLRGRVKSTQGGSRR